MPPTSTLKRCVSLLFVLVLFSGVTIAAIEKPEASARNQIFPVVAERTTDTESNGVELSRLNRETIWYGGDNGNGIALWGGIWTWDNIPPGGDPLQGWTFVDKTTDPGVFFEWVTAESFIDDSLPYEPGFEGGFLWCGVHQAEASELGYQGGLGYGHNFCQKAVSPAIEINPLTDDISIQFDYFNVTEPDYDFTYVNILCFDASSELIATIEVDSFTDWHGDIWNPVSFFRLIDHDTLDPSIATVRCELYLEADAQWDDEDGLYPTQTGPFGADSVMITIGGTDTVYDFDDGPQGWTFEKCPGIGSYLSVIPPETYNGWLADLGLQGCGISGNVLASVDGNGIHPQQQWEAAYSGKIYAPGGGYDEVTLSLDSALYLPFDSKVFYRYMYRYYPSGPDPDHPVWSTLKGGQTYLYANDPSCSGEHIPLSPDCYMESLQVVLEVISDGSAFGLPPGDGDTHGMPLWDNVRVGFSPASVFPCCQGEYCMLETECHCNALGGFLITSREVCDPNPCMIFACCDADNNCTMTAMADCDDDLLIGVFTCDPNPCTSMYGACCYDDNCYLTLETDCLGTWVGAGTVCLPIQCETGACCAADGSCAETLIADCQGTWTISSACDPNPCPQPSGACCASDGSCTVTLQADCPATWTMFGDCDPNPCQQPLGACCAPDGSCMVTLEISCFDEWTAGNCDPNICQQPPSACCFEDGDCELLYEEECVGQGTWYPMLHLCEPTNPCPQPMGSCCAANGECTVTLLADCSDDWTMFGVCDPNPCPQPMGSCCAANGECSDTQLADCPDDWTMFEVCEPTNPCPQPMGSCCAANGDCSETLLADCPDDWIMFGVCEPNPCSQQLVASCCFIDGHCELLTEDECTGDWMPDYETCLLNPCEMPLSGGTLIAHSPPGMVYSSGADWCQVYETQYQLTNPAQQNSRIDPVGYETVVWYVLAAWDTPQRFCGVDFGFGTYNPDVFIFTHAGPCFPDAGLQIPSGGWPGPEEGVAVTATSTSWYGNYVPVYWFAGYSYTPGQIPFSVNPITGDASFGSCSAPVIGYDISCLGTLGVNTDGVECYPPDGMYPCCIGMGCAVLPYAACVGISGVPMPAFESCEPNPCFESACCAADGICTLTTLVDCVGDWMIGEPACDPNPCDQPQRACCIGENCSLLTESDCSAGGGVYLPSVASCDPDPCLIYACCAGDGTCALTLSVDCADDWMIGVLTCDPNPCDQPYGSCCYVDGQCEYVQQADCLVDWTMLQDCNPNPCDQLLGTCCYPDGSCESLLEAECQGDWTDTYNNCDPNPCPQPVGACCVDTFNCSITTENDCDNIQGEWLSGYETCNPNPCELPLDGGVLIVHSPPGIQWSAGADWCQLYNDEHQLTSAGQQNSRIDPIGAETSVWFVLAAWEEARRFCGADFGFGGYDPAVMEFVNAGPCFPDVGLEIPTGNWPGPDEGVAIITTTTAWSGNYVPLYWFAGYSYAAGQIPLSVNPTTGNASFGSCSAPVVSYEATCVGALGINSDGVDCYPPLGLYACCVDQVCSPMTLDNCVASGGEWMPPNEGCDPNPCFEYACCAADGTCTLTLSSDCGGDWLVGQLVCDPNPCPPPTGSCCYADGHCEHVVEADCPAIWTMFEVCDPNPCEQPQRACCIEQDCQVLTEENCTAGGGDYLSSLESCDPDPCLDYACCSGETCQIMRADECASAGGQYYTGVENCDPNPCLFRACCTAEFCQVLNYIDCAIAGGDLIISISTCDPNPCPKFACCTDAACQIKRQDECETAGGQFLPGLASCFPDPCGLFACCLADDCQLLIETQCLAAGGLWLDSMDNCEPNPCIDRVCCTGTECEITSHETCAAGGGDWFEDLTSCSFSPCSPNVALVKPDGSGDFASIQAAIDALFAGDTILLTNGTFTGPGNVEIHFDGKALVLSSESGAPANCIIDCDYSQGFSFGADDGPDVFIDGITITNGSAADGGGIVCSNGASPVLSNLVLTGNQATSGGAISCQDQSNPVITNVVFNGNSADVSGGGIYLNTGSVPVLRNLTFYQNSAQVSGSAIAIEQNSIAQTVENVIVQENIGIGAIYIESPLVTFTCSNIFANAGGDWTGNISGQLGVDGNISLDSEFCDSPAGNFTLNSVSPCAPAYNPTCGLIGAREVDCGILSRACCTDQACEITTETSCLDSGGVWLPGSSVCDPNPCLLAACCDNEMCQILILSMCTTAGGDWLSGVEACDPSPCQINACCTDLVCELLREDECAALAGEWQIGIDTCDPNPCIPFACCHGETCEIITLFACNAAGGVWLDNVAQCDPDPCSAFVCCVGETCELLTLNDCINAGGEWDASINSCDADPCRLKACCIGTECFVQRPNACLMSGGLWLADIPACDPNPCVEYACCVDVVCQLQDYWSCLAGGGQWQENVTSCDPNPCLPQTIQVMPDGSGMYPNIQAAVNGAENDDTILLHDGIYSGPGNRDIDLLGKAITIRSISGDREACIIDCESAARGFLFINGETAATRLIEMTIRNGNADGPDESGGAIFCDSASPGIFNCRFETNTATRGGAIAYDTATEALIFSCLFLANTGTEVAGAIECLNSNLTLEGCEFQNNSSTYEGGAVECVGSNVMFYECTLVGNSSSSGSGIVIKDMSYVQIENCIIASNLLGEGVACINTDPPILACTDIFNNTGGDWIGIISGQLGIDGNISVNPYFCDPASNDLTLFNTSLCAPENNPQCGLIGARPVACGLEAPSNLIAWTSGPEEITLSWEDNSETETGFDIEQKQGADGLWQSAHTTAANITLWVNGGLAAGETYFYRARAASDLGYSHYSNQASSTCGDVPSAPDNLIAEAVSPVGVDLSWNDSASNEYGFNIQRREGISGDWIDLAPNPGANIELFEDRGLEPEIEYGYRIRAYNNIGPSAWSVSLPVTTPVQVQGFSAEIVVHHGVEPVDDVLVYVASGAGYSEKGITDPNGRLTIPGLEIGDSIRVVKYMATYPSVKSGHEAVNDLMWELWLDSDLIQIDGEYKPYIIESVADEYQTPLVHPIFRYNLVISLQWDLASDDPYWTLLESGFNQAARYLYNATDGHVTFGDIAIYDDGENWNKADIKIRLQESPQADIDGIYVSSAFFGSISLGWTIAGQFPDHLVYYRTIVREFCSYALGLYPENENGLGLIEWWQSYRGSHPDQCPFNYGLMDYPYITTELSSANDYLAEYPEPLSPWLVTNQYYRRQMSCWDWLANRLEGGYPGIHVIKPAHGWYPDNVSPDRLGPNSDQELNGDWVIPDGAAAGSMVAASIPPTAVSYFDHGGEAFRLELITSFGSLPAAGALLYLDNTRGVRLLGQVPETGSLQVAGLRSGDRIIAFYRNRQFSHKQEYILHSEDIERRVAEIQFVDVPDADGPIAAGYRDDVTAPGAAIDIEPFGTESYPSIRVTIWPDEALSMLPEVTCFSGANTGSMIMTEIPASFAYTGEIVLDGTAPQYDGSGFCEITLTDQSANTGTSVVNFRIGSAAIGTPVKLTCGDIDMQVVSDVEQLTLASASNAAPHIPAEFLWPPVTGMFSLHLSDLDSYAWGAGVNISYENCDLTGIDETSLKLMTWNIDDRTWVVVDSALVGTGNNRISAPIYTGGTFCIFASETTQDQTSPAMVTDLSAVGAQGQGLIQLEWTATGDDGMLGVATNYSVAYSETPITEAAWDDLPKLPGMGAPSAAGNHEMRIVTLPESDRLYYLGLKASDESGNLSPLSNVAYAVSGDTDANYLPAPPTQFRAVDKPGDEGNAISLSWISSADDGAGQATVTAYRIYRDQPPATTPVLIETVSSGVTLYDDLTAANDTLYTYYLSATDGEYEIFDTENRALSAQNTGAPVGDFSSDQCVAINDMSWLVDSYGINSEDPEFDPLFDLDSNGDIYSGDFTIFSSSYGVGSTVSTVPAGQNGNALIYAEFEVTPGDQLLLRVTVGNAVNLAGYGIDLQYPDQDISLISVIPDSPGEMDNFLTQSGGLTPLFLVNEPAPGMLHIANAIKGPSTISAPDGDGLLAKLTFTGDNLFEIIPQITIDQVVLMDHNKRLNTREVSWIPDGHPSQELRPLLFQNQPNPFDQTTVIRFQLPDETTVKLGLYDVSGRLVNILARGQWTAGMHAVEWGGIDSNGKTVSSGIYFYTLEAGNYRSIRKLIMLK
jgi:predicted outer membrane repeat protein